MIRFGRHSISFRIASILTVIITVSIVSFSAIILLLTRRAIFYERDRDVLQTIQLLEDTVRAMNPNQHAPDVNGIPYYMFYRISDGNGRLLRTNDPMIPQLPETPAESPQRYYRENFFIDGNLNLLYAAKTVTVAADTQNGYPERTFHIQAAQDIDADTADDLIHLMPAIFAACCIPVLMVSWMIAYRATRNMLRPVRRITEQAAEIGSEHLDRRLDESGADDELKLLAHTFNNLFARLQTDFEQQKRFTADVSHELKTPLAVLSGYADMLDRWGKNDRQVLEEAIAVLKRETASMTHLIESLFKLNRSRNEALSVYTKEPIQLRPFLLSVQQDFALIAPQARITVDCPDTAVVHSSAEGLKEILRILIQNSIQYSAPEPRITLSYKDGVLCESDNGCGIPPEDLPHIFESFYRVDKARSRASGNSGLGLAIAKAVAERMQLTISAQSTLGEGTAISLQFKS